MIAWCCLWKKIPRKSIGKTTHITAPKFNKEPENRSFQKESPFFPGADFQVNHVKLQGCRLVEVNYCI